MYAESKESNHVPVFEKRIFEAGSIWSSVSKRLLMDNLRGGVHVMFLHLPES